MNIQKLSTPAIFYLTVSLTANLISLFIAPYQCKLSLYSCVLLLLGSVILTLVMIYVISWVINILAISGRPIFSWSFSFLFILLNLTDLYYLILQNKLRRLKDSTSTPTPRVVFIEKDGTVTPVSTTPVPTTIPVSTTPADTTSIESEDSVSDDESDDEPENVFDKPFGSFRKEENDEEPEMKSYDYDVPFGKEIGGGNDYQMGGGDSGNDYQMGGGSSQIDQDMDVVGSNVLTNIDISVPYLDTNQRSIQDEKDETTDNNYYQPTTRPDMPFYSTTQHVSLFGTTLPGMMEDKDMPGTSAEMETTIPTTSLPVTPYESVKYKSSTTKFRANKITPYHGRKNENKKSSGGKPEHKTTTANDDKVFKTTARRSGVNITPYSNGKSSTNYNDITLSSKLYKLDGLPSKSSYKDSVTAYDKKGSNDDNDISKAPFSTMNSGDKGSYATFNRPESEKDYGFSGFGSYSSSRYGFV